jgi:hypothetical protein
LRVFDTLSSERVSKLITDNFSKIMARGKITHRLAREFTKPVSDNVVTVLIVPDWRTPGN